MTQIALIRHGPTDWNEQKRLQGRADRRLSDTGRARVATWSVPAEFAEYEWVVSPLTRATETARLLGLRCETEHAIIEMDWGDWEGSTLVELQAIYGADEISRRTTKGLDLRPHGGETPREVRDRVATWAMTVAHRATATGAVAHQGVIRALLSLATGWEMVGKPPYVLEWSAVHVFEVDTDGGVAIGRLNISMEGAP